jgi:hypothetical protein
MFHVATVNLTADARHGDAGSGPRRAVEMSADELIALLEVFAEIDAHENNEADAEIRVDSRRNRFVIRTAQRKLFLHNPRDLAEPAYVLSAREIIAELDGSAADARRTAAPLPLPLVTDRGTSSGDGEFLNELPARPPPEPPSFPFVLVALVVALGGYVIYAEFFAPRGDPMPVLTPLSATELVAEESALTGSYMTGSEPGHHGIVILAGGRLELFQVNARGGPGTVYATYTLGRKNGALNLSTDQPGGLIIVNSRDALEFCGETYKRVKGG